MRLFRRAFADGDVSPAESLLLRHSMREARTVGDPAAGNWKLAKKQEGGRRANARDDAAAALVLAVAEGARLRRQQPKRRPFRLVKIG